MPGSYASEVRRQVLSWPGPALVRQLAAMFGMSEARIYNWLRQERIDSGEA